MLYELNIKINRKTHYLNLLELIDSNNHKAIVHRYRNGKYNFINFTGEVNDKQIEAIKGYLDEACEWELVSESYENSIWKVILKTSCTKLYPNCILDIAEKNNCMPIYPVVFKNGWEHIKFLCFSEKDISELLKDLGTEVKFVIKSIHSAQNQGFISNHLLTIEEIMGRLTDHQIEILFRVFRDGYYEIPRENNLKDISESLGITRQAASKSVRKAENNIMEMLIPIIYQYKKGQSN